MLQGSPAFPGVADVFEQLQKIWTVSRSPFSGSSLSYGVRLRLLFCVISPIKSLSWFPVTCKLKSISAHCLKGLCSPHQLISAFLPPPLLQPHQTRFGLLFPLPGSPPRPLFPQPASFFLASPAGPLAHGWLTLNSYWMKQCLKLCFLFCSFISPRVSFKKIFILMPICTLYLGLHILHTGFYSCAVLLLLETESSSLK